MARGEVEGLLLTVQTTLTYDATVNYGHANAGKDLVLSLDQSDGNAVLGANGAKILGKFLSLDSDKVATVMVNATPMLLRKSAATIKTGVSLVAAGSGQVKSTPSTETAESAERGRGQTIKILETGTNGRILALIP